MAVFLSCIGLEAGHGFFGMLASGHGMALLGWAALITLAPMFLVGLFMRLVMKINFITLTGFIAGAMTSSPTLLFSSEITESSAPSLAYAAVYPLSMLIPISGPVPGDRADLRLVARVSRTHRPFRSCAGMDEAWQFFSTAENLPLITPPWLRFTIAMRGADPNRTGFDPRLHHSLDGRADQVADEDHRLVAADAVYRSSDPRAVCAVAPPASVPADQQRRRWSAGIG